MTQFKQGELDLSNPTPHTFEVHFISTETGRTLRQIRVEANNTQAALDTARDKFEDRLPCYRDSYAITHCFDLGVKQ